MIEIDARLLVSELLAGQLLQFREISEQLQSRDVLEERHTTLERFKRWRERTYRIIVDYIDLFEAEKFERLSVHNMLSYEQHGLWFSLGTNELKTFEGHMATLFESVEKGSKSVNTARVRKITFRLLIELYEATERNRPYKSSDQLADLLGLDWKEINPYLAQLIQRQIVVTFYDDIRLSVAGTAQVKKLMTSNYESFEARQVRVLRMLYEMSGPNHMGYVELGKLITVCGLEFRELLTILNDLEDRKGLVEGYEQAVRLSAAGIEEMEQAKKTQNSRLQTFRQALSIMSLTLRSRDSNNTLKKASNM